MHNFNQILQRLSETMEEPLTSNHFRGVMPFKVQVKFDIPLFEVHIDVDALEKLLNLLEGYFFYHNFSNSEKINFMLLKALPHVICWWVTYFEKIVEDESVIFGPRPTWEEFFDSLKE
jgi:hypothetical protein